MKSEGYQFSNPVKTAFGKSALSHLPFDLYAMNVRKPLIIATKETRHTGALDHLLDAFKESTMTTGIYDNADSKVSLLEIIRDLTGLYTQKGFDAIIAIGGGRVVDLSKLLNISVSLGPGALRSCKGRDHVPAPLNPLVYVACKAGNGLEATKFLELPDRFYSSTFLMPDMAVIDPVMFSGKGLAADTVNETLAALSNSLEAIAVSDSAMLRANAQTVVATIMNALSDLIPGFAEGQTSPVSSLPVKNASQLSARLALASVINAAVISNGEDLILRKLGRAVSHRTGTPEGACASILLPGALSLLCPESKTQRLLLCLTDANRSCRTPAPEKFRTAMALHKLAVDTLCAAGKLNLPGTISETGLSQKNTDAVIREFSDETQTDIRLLSQVFTDDMSGQQEKPATGLYR